MYKILLALDPNKNRAKKAAKAIESLPCSSQEVEVVILNVSQEFEVSDTRGVNSSDFYDPTDFPESVSIAVKLLEDSGINVTTRREHGEPTELITSVADEIDADCIAMSGRKRTPTGKVLFGSVTQSVLLAANRPVQVVINE